MKDEMTTDQTPDFLASPATRRQLLTMAAVGGASVAAVAAAGPRPRGAAARPGTNGEVVRLTVLGTTDLHGNVLNWDYFKDAVYADSGPNESTWRRSHDDQGGHGGGGRRAHPHLDAGDTMQGTPLAYYFAKVDPITGG